MGNRWTPEAAHRWFARQPWLVGCNFTPSNAINQLEMWQAGSFDLATIDRELELAASVGMNRVRVYLHDMLWLDDAAAFLAGLDPVLAGADRPGPGTRLVVFDSVGLPKQALGLH